MYNTHHCSSLYSSLYLLHCRAYSWHHWNVWKKQKRDNSSNKREAISMRWLQSIIETKSIVIGHNSFANSISIVNRRKSKVVLGWCRIKSTPPVFVGKWMNVIKRMIHGKELPNWKIFSPSRHRGIPTEGSMRSLPSSEPFWSNVTSVKWL